MSNKTKSKYHDCPTCGKQPTKLRINGMPIVSCLPCVPKYGPNGATGESMNEARDAWNEQSKLFAAEIEKQSQKKVR